MTSCSVLIADDDPSVRSLLKVLLDSEQGIKVAGTARNGDEAVKESHRLRPDVVLMDVQMPVTDGPEAARALCSDADGPRVIMLTMFDLDSYVYEALRAGASGFLLKNSPPAAVVAAVRTAQEGTPMLSPQITRRLVAQLAPVRPSRPVQSLTPRERETLGLIAQGMSNTEIADTMYVTPTTARTYVSRLLTNLQVRDRAQLVVLAYENGVVDTRQN